MTQTTLERPSSTPESEKGSRLDLSKITVSEHLSETSPFELRTIEPTAERPAAVYMAAPKVEDADTMTGSFVAFKEDEVFWQADSHSMGVVRGRADGSLEPLGVGDNAPLTGTFKVESGETAYFVTHEFIDVLKDKKQFNKDGINLALDDEDLRKEVIAIAFDTALVEATPDTGKAAHNIAGRDRRREEKRLKELREQRTTSNADASLASEAQTATNSPDINTSTTIPTPNTAQAAYARRLRDAHQQKRASQSAPENTITSSEPSTATTATELVRDMDDEERQYLEDERRGFKVTDNRKWSRVEILGHEVGIHSDVSFTVPPKPVAPKEAATEVLNVVESTDVTSAGGEAAKVAALISVPEKEAVSATPQGSTVPFEVIDYNPNNDPAIEYGLTQLDALRIQMASLTANRQNRLFNFNGKKSREIARTYNDQLVTLGQIVTADKLSDDTLTDSQKNLAVMKFLVNEQATLQAATKEKLEGTKEGKFVEWMSIRGRTADSTADVRKVMQAIEQATPGDDKVALAHRHMATLYKERIRSEKKERMHSAARVAAIGVVGMAATVLGINPSVAGDAANAIFYGTRKR
jgi:hypothetical protein